ncbi:MAG: endolytic transglycosylase MltG [Thiohalospira sp.]
MNLNRLLGFLLLAASLGGGWIWMGLDGLADQTLGVEEETVMEVSSGTSLKEIAAGLEEKGVIDSAWQFEWLVRLRGDSRTIAVGEYPLRPEMTVGELADRLLKGELKQYAWTLVEGWNIHQVLASLHDHPAVEHTLPEDPNALMDSLGEPSTHPEGRFLPDTYFFTRGTTDRELLRRARQAMRQALAEVWEGRPRKELPLDSPEEALILASIVEKETAVPEERRRIAGVFTRRLQQDMRLQTDPTVIYGIGAGFDGDLTRDHLGASGNEYNTYRHGGLPPTPIAMPGRASLEAAVDPGEGEALYFVSKGDGSHHFSATLEEHNRAVRRFQLGEED